MLQRDVTIAVLVAAAIILVVSFAPLPDNTRFDGETHDFAHVLVFGLMGYVLARTLRRVPARPRGRGLVAAIVLGVGLLAGIGTEYAQSLLGGVASWGDVGRDVLGSALGFLVVIAVESATPRRLQFAIGAVVAGSLFVAATPLAQMLLDYRARAALFPVLFDAVAPRALAFIEPSGDHTDNTDTARSFPPGLSVPLQRGPWPGVTLAEPVRDWHGWRALSIELVNPGDTALPLVVRVNDRAHDNRFEDRFNRDIMLGPHSRQRFEFPIADIEAAPQGRRMDLGQIDKLVVFHAGPAPGREFRLDRIALVR